MLTHPRQESYSVRRQTEAPRRLPSGSLFHHLVDLIVVTNLVVFFPTFEKAWGFWVRHHFKSCLCVVQRVGMGGNALFQRKEERKSIEIHKRSDRTEEGCGEAEG